MHATHHRPSPFAIRVAPTALAAIALLASPLTAQDASEFRAGLRTISRSAATDWGQAKDQLDALLARHADADYARHARTEVVDLHRRIAFESSYVQPKPKDLISGDLVMYKPKSGRIKLVYTRKTMRDFLDPNKPKPVAKPQRRTRPGQFPTIKMPKMPRFGPEYRPRIHPARFRSCKIEVTGARYSSTELLTGITDSGAFRTLVGEPLTSRGFGGSTYVPTLIIRKTDDESDELFRKTWLSKKKKGKEQKSLWPMKRGGKYTVVLDVTPKSLRLRINRKSAAKESWTDAVVGRIGIADSTFDQLTITGQVEPAWLQGLSDNHRQEAHNKFTARYKPAKQLPAWLFAEPKIAVDTSALQQRRYYPGKEKPKNLKAVHGVLSDLNEGRSSRVLFRLALWKDDKAPPLVKQYLQSYAYMVDGSFQKSIELAEQVVAADPEFGDGHIVLGKSYLALRRNKDAEGQFRKVLKLLPTLGNAYCDLAMALLRQVKAAEAREVLGDATSRGLANDRMHNMRRIVDRIIDGPTFGKSYTIETEHYRITSDIDERVCKDAGKVLEGAFAFYCRMLGNVRQKFDGERFQVYLFSGEKGYRRYLDGLDLRIPIHTAGVYSPELQQLLIWNLPTRTNMLRTIRHEGFHQYFDMVAPDVPVWLNEGLAEYFEVSRYKAGKPTAGIIRPSHIRALALIRPSARRPLDTFMKITPRQFYGPTAGLNYAQSWALVRYLRGGTPSVRAVFDRLVKALATGKSRDEALAIALEGVDMERLSKGYWASIDKLIDKK